MVCVAGFTPDIFGPLLVGALLDGYPGRLGYRYLFSTMAALCALGLLVSVAFRCVTTTAAEAGGGGGARSSGSSSAGRHGKAGYSLVQAPTREVC